MIFDTVIKIYQKYYLCVHCLGRMFSLLGSHTTNQDRGNSLLLALTMENHKKFLSRTTDQQQLGLENLLLLAENAKYLPAQSVLKNEGKEYSISDSTHSCYLCEDIFSNIERYIEKAILNLEGIEFNSFLIGTTPDSQIINREDKFKSEFKILEAESFKGHFNRVVGKNLMKRLNKTPEFNNPDVLIIFSLDFKFFDVNFNLKSLFIYGKYNKLIRGIPQTHWDCKNCMGKGCPKCNYSGKQYITSVEELISPEFIKESKATDSKFHGAGREDIDVRMLGTGRPFIIELRNPKIRTLNLVKIEKKVNRENKNKISIHNLRYSFKKEVIQIKSDDKNTIKSELKKRKLTAKVVRLSEYKCGSDLDGTRRIIQKIISAYEFQKKIERIEGK